MPNITEKEWEKIISQAFSPDLPDPKFSKHYHRKKNSILKLADDSAERSNFTMKNSKIGFAVLTACVAGMAGFVIYGGVNVYQIGHSVQSSEESFINPGSAVEVQTESIPEITETEPIQENTISVETLPYVQRVEFQCQENDYTADGGCYALIVNWVPGNLELREDGPYGGKYHDYTNENSDIGITPSFCRVADVSKSFIEDVNYATDRFEMDLDSDTQPKHMVLITRDRGYDKLFVHFEGTPYVADYFINGLTQEEAIQLAENMTLVESDVETAGIMYAAWTLEKQFEGIKVNSDIDDSLYVDWNTLNLVHVGDTITKAEIWGDSEYHECPDIQLTINDAVLQKDFTGITTNSIGGSEDFSQYLDENGEIYANRIKYTVGDGMTTLDEIVEETSVHQYVLKLDLTLTKISDENQLEDYESGLCFCGERFSINDGIISSWLHDDAEGVEIQYEPQLASEMFFSFATDHEHEKNGIYHLEAGESADVTLCYIIDENQIGNLYVNLFSNVYTVNLGMPVLDLTDLTIPE